MTFIVEVVTGTGVESHTYSDVPCGHAGRPETLDVPGVTSVNINGFGAEHEGAWHVAVLGRDAG